MSRTTQVPRLVNFHELRLRQSSLNFSVPARFPVEGVLAGAYGFLLLVIFLPDDWLYWLSRPGGDSVAYGVSENTSDESCAGCFLDGFQRHEQGEADEAN
jgi:hypothetical protein